MSEPIMVHRITARAATEDPFESLHSAITFSSMDWSQAGDVAWIYGIVVGWDDDDDETGDGGAIEELAQRHGWSEAAVARLRRLHAEFVRHSTQGGA